ncbi:MAG TPA: FAD-dependent oxidoreductase [Gemmatimonadaceae bacterium]|jgi:glycine oxidase|nr:FAD-dependent oxidoreductase [Gemmatimonadaceae bacterium]
MAADAMVVGAGVIALTAAVELADRGVRVCLIGTAHRGEASSAAAGILAPSTEAGLGQAHAFAVASRDRYPEYLAMLEARTGIPVPLNRLGILEIAFTEEELELIDGAAAMASLRLDAGEVGDLEPAIGHTVGGVLHPHDGALDPLLLLDALRLLVSRHPNVTVYSENVREFRAGMDGCQVVTDQENRYQAPVVVLAAGAWTPCIAGLPRTLQIEPVRGQLVAFGGTLLRHVIYSAQGYVVPKSDGHTLVGSTMEHVGFVPETTEEGILAVRGIGERICPVLKTTPMSAAWAGLRPVTPDLLPMLGADPDFPNVVYACGHSRNGILMAPATAEVVADVVTGGTSRYDLSQFRPDRF